MSDGFKHFRWEKEYIHNASSIKYKTVTEDFELNDADGNMEATMFSYSYIAQPEDSKRPVMFCYNGGPGGNSNWVHLGFLGPEIINIPGYPYVKKNAKATLVENEHFLIDVCDIVLINPVGTEYTCATERGKKKYFNSNGDCDSYVMFIKDWLKKNGRESSPVYLCGESYGTLRSLIVANRMSCDIDIRGIIFIGVSWNFASKTMMCVEPNVRRLGADAAASWFHYHKNEHDFNEYIDSAIEFAYGDYSHALLVGNRLSEKTRDEVAEKLSEYTHLDKEFLLANNLRFSEREFLQKFLPDGVISTYDARIKLMRSEMTSDGSDGFDLSNEPFMAIIGTQFDSLMKDYIERCMKVPEGREWYSRVDICRNWNFVTPEDTMILAETLIKEKKQIKYMIANGYYDLQSTFDFVLYYLSQHDLPSERTKICFYMGGHACYVGDTVDSLIKDARDFLQE